LAITADDIVKLSPSKKLGILGGILAVIIALFVWQVIWPVYEQYDQKTVEYNKLKADLNEKKKAIQDLAKFQARLESLTRELVVMKAQLPDKKEIPELLKTISSLGRESGLTFLLFKPRPEVLKDFYAEIPVEMQVEGGYHEVAKFFWQIGMLDRIVNVSNLDMGKATEDKGQMQLTTSCLATTFRFVEAPATGGAPAKPQAPKPATTKP
jgi:type IV pilus assembly protein PilO